MLKLIRALSEYNGPTYDGAVMARAVIKASVLENRDYSTRPVKMAPPRMGIIEAYKEGAASLTVTLLRPLVRAGEMPETVVPEISFFARNNLVWKSFHTIFYRPFGMICHTRNLCKDFMSDFLNSGFDTSHY